MNLLDYVKSRRDAYADQIRSFQTSGDTYGVAYYSTLAVKAELDHLIQMRENVPTPIGYDPRETPNINPTYTPSPQWGDH